jgi:hypothetical protein
MNEVEYEGTPNFWLEGVTIRRRFDGLDELSGTYFTDNALAISPGNTCPSPYATFKARDVEVLIEPESMAELRVSAVGIYGSKGGRRLNASFTLNQEGFDDGVEVWLRPDKTGFGIGQQSSIQPGMYCTDISFEEIDVDSDYQRVTVKYRGILASKDQKIHLSTSAREMGIENVAVKNLPGGWDDPRSGDILWPRAEVKTSFVQTTAPIMSDIPSPASPPFNPGVFNPPLTGELKWHWPNGWVITAREAEKLVSANVWFITETYTYNAAATF